MPATVSSPLVLPELTSEQRTTLLAATSELIAAAATDRSALIIDPDLAGLANVPVAGVFVSLKRGSHLRGCTGGLRQHPVPLGQALADAAENTVLRDQRFPVVSPAETAFLNLEIWLLHNPQDIDARGDDRVGRVEIGRHGLVIARGMNRGLLLPGVAVEQGWDARTFLERTCEKAGLHPSLWRDDETSLMTFEGEAIEGAVADYVEPTESPPVADAEELQGYFDFCWENIVALFRRGPLRFFDPGLRDVSVNGVSLRLRPPNSAKSIHLTNLSLRGGGPVQNILLQLGQLGAQQLVAHGVRLDTLHTVGMGLSLFGDPNLHGSLASHDLRGSDPANRAILIIDRNRQGIAYRPDLSSAEVVAEAALQAQAAASESASVFSLKILTTDKQVTISNVPEPRRGPADRPPAVAGAFYPADGSGLSRMVEELLDRAAASSSSPRRAVAAAMVPHAGLRFSGHVAAQVFQSIELPRTIIVLGPKHTPLGMDWAVAPHQTWHIPSGEISSDFMLARKLSHAIPGLSLDCVAHQREHAIEVELPFIARLAPHSRVIGIVLGAGEWKDAERFAEGLAKVVADLPEPPLLMISSDMNHFATDAENRRLDEIALAALERLDPEAAFREITARHISMCGVFPAVVVMETLRRLDRLHRAVRRGYATSAEASGDASRVVGYAGMLFD